MFFIGIDIAKYTHFASVVNSDGEVLIKPFSFSESAEGFDSFLSRISSFPINDCLVGLEATGHYSENLVLFLHEKGYNIGIINPIQTDSLRNSNIRKTKNDKVDTFLIAQCLMLKKYTPFKPQDALILQLKTLTRYRSDLVNSRSKLKLQLVTSIDLVFPEIRTFFYDLHCKTSYAILAKYTSPSNLLKAKTDALLSLMNHSSRGRYSFDDCIRLKNLAKSSIGIKQPAHYFKIKMSIEQIQYIDEQIDTIELEIKRIMDDIKSPIMSIPGIGYVLGATIISEIGDISRFDSAKKLIAYAGLDPTTKQSGTFIASNTKISKRGSKHLRYAIIYASFASLQGNNVFHAYYTTKRAEGKVHRNALGHVATKMTRIIFKLLSENIAFSAS